MITICMAVNQRVITDPKESYQLVENGHPMTPLKKSLFFRLDQPERMSTLALIVLP